MSYNSSPQPIDPFKLLGDAISQTAPIYLPLLIISTPSLIVVILDAILPKSVFQPLSIVYNIVGLPVLSGIMMYFVHKYLKQGTIDLSGAVSVGTSKAIQLILGFILYILAVFAGLLCLVIPGIYLSIIFAFVVYAISTENLSAIDALKYSTQLVKGRWWAVFGSMLSTLIFFVPIFFVGIILGVVMGGNPNLEKLASIVGGVLGFIVTPPMTVYLMKIYHRLQETTLTQPNQG
jgi:hypothetical protein